MVDAVLFDVNETLFGLDPLQRRLQRAGAVEGDLERWFHRVLIDGLAASAAGTYVSFPELARHHAARLLEVAPDDPSVADVLAGFDEVVVHDDAAAAFAVLRERDVTVVTFTNGTAAVTDAALQRAGLRAQVDHVWDVGEVRRWKPAPEAYRWACDRLGLAPERVALVAVHPWDVYGARAAGLRGGLVNRPGGATPPPAFGVPDASGPDLGSVVDQLTAGR